MPIYKLLVARKVTMTGYAYVEADGPDTAAARFQHMLASDAPIDGLDDEAQWGEAYYYQVVKAGPNSGEFEVLDVELDD